MRMCALYLEARLHGAEGLRVVPAASGGCGRTLMKGWRRPVMKDLMWPRADLDVTTPPAGALRCTGSTEST